MAEHREGKSDIRAWIYQLLAQLEYAEDAEGERTESAGGEVIIKVQLKY